MRRMGAVQAGRWRLCAGWRRGLSLTMRHSCVHAFACARACVRAGGVGSLIALLTTYPLKTIYTLQAIRAVKKARGDRALHPAQLAVLLRSPAAAVMVLLHDTDWASLYAGLGPAAVETAISSAVYFYFYSMLRQVCGAARCAVGSRHHTPAPPRPKCGWQQLLWSTSCRDAHAPARIAPRLDLLAGCCWPCRRLLRPTSAAGQLRVHVRGWRIKTSVCWPAWSWRRLRGRAISLSQRLCRCNQGWGVDHAWAVGLMHCRWDQCLDRPATLPPAACDMSVVHRCQVVTTQMQANTKLKQRLAEEGQASEHIPTSTWAVCRQLYQEEGLAGFWKGGRDPESFQSSVVPVCCIRPRRGSSVCCMSPSRHWTQPHIGSQSSGAVRLVRAADVRQSAPERAKSAGRCPQHHVSCPRRPASGSHQTRSGRGVPSW